MMGKSHLTKLITFCDQISGLVDEGKTVNVVYFDLNMAFDALSLDIPLDKLIKYGLGKWKVSWTETDNHQD